MTNSEKSSAKTVELRISIPAWKPPARLRPILSRYNELSKRQKLYLNSGLVALLIGSAYAATHQQGAILGGILGTDANASQPEVLRAPNYPTLLPNGKNIEVLGGWSRVSPPKSNPVFAYVDSLDGSPINVSQQPLPENFKKDRGAQIEKLATNFGARERVTAGGATVFIGTSTEGPQSVIFEKNNTLILIKSAVSHSEDTWAEYINSLR